MFIVIRLNSWNERCVLNGYPFLHPYTAVIFLSKPAKQRCSVSESSKEISLKLLKETINSFLRFSESSRAQLRMLSLYLSKIILMLIAYHCQIP
jgi:hypothetical protein